MVKLFSYVFAAGFFAWHNGDVVQTLVTPTICLQVTSGNGFRLSQNSGTRIRIQHNFQMLILKLRTDQKSTEQLLQMYFTFHSC